MKQKTKWLKPRAWIPLLAHHLFQLKRRLRVKTRERLVENPNRGIVNQRAHYHNLLAHTVRVG